MTSLLTFLIFIGIILAINIFFPFFWPLKWVYFFMFRPKEQKEHEEMIAGMKDYLKRKMEFEIKIKKLKEESNGPVD